MVSTRIYIPKIQRNETLKINENGPSFILIACRKTQKTINLKCSENAKKENPSYKFKYFLTFEEQHKKKPTFRVYKFPHLKIKSSRRTPTDKMI